MIDIALLEGNKWGIILSKKKVGLSANKVVKPHSWLKTTCTPIL